MENETEQIVQLPAHEWQAYKSLRLEALQNDPQAFGTSYREAAAKPDSYWQARLADANRGLGSWLLFVQKGQSPVGMVAAILDAEKAGTAIILSVYMSKPERGKGLSKIMLAVMLETLKKDGVKNAWLEVNTEQMAAIRLYESAGFKTCAIHSNLMGTGSYHDEYFMEITL